MVNAKTRAIKHLLNLITQGLSFLRSQDEISAVSPSAGERYTLQPKTPVMIVSTSLAGFHAIRFEKKMAVHFIITNKD